MKPPCSNCKERHAECHPSCEKYREWKIAHEKEKAIIQEKRWQDREMYEFRGKGYRKMAKKYGKKV